MSSAEHIYKKYRQADDDVGDLAWAAKLGKRAVWLPGEERTESALGNLELNDDEKIVAKLLRLPRRFSDVETCGVLPDKQVRRFLRALHAAEVLETQDLEQATYLLRASERVWKRLFAGRMDPLFALVLGQLRLQRGEISQLTHQAKAAQQLLLSAQRL